MSAIAVLGLVVCVAFTPAVGSAQTRPATPQPDYMASIALHVTAVTVAVLSTAFALTTVAFIATPCARDCAELPVLPFMISAATLAPVALVLGIAATVVHSATRASSGHQSSLAWRPLAAVGPDGAGIGLALDF